MMAELTSGQAALLHHDPRLDRRWSLQQQDRPLARYDRHIGMTGSLGPSDTGSDGRAAIGLAVRTMGSTHIAPI